MSTIIQKHSVIYCVIFVKNVRQQKITLSSIVKHIKKTSKVYLSLVLLVIVNRTLYTLYNSDLVLMNDFFGQRLALYHLTCQSLMQIIDFMIIYLFFCHENVLE